MLNKLRPIFNVLLIVFALYTLYSLWTAPLPENNLNKGQFPLNTIPVNNDIPPGAIPLGTKVKEVWDHNPNGPSKATSEEFYYNPDNTGMYYDHQYWLDNEVYCGGYDN